MASNISRKRNRGSHDWQTSIISNTVKTPPPPSVSRNNDYASSSTTITTVVARTATGLLSSILAATRGSTTAVPRGKPLVQLLSVIFLVFFVFLSDWGFSSSSSISSSSSVRIRLGNQVWSPRRCFANKADLADAVRVYADTRLSNRLVVQAQWKLVKTYGYPIGQWCLGNVTDLSNLFRYMTTFNEPLDHWDVSQITTMDRLFAGASSFNQTLAAWNVSSVTSMNAVFNAAKSFNQPLNAWKVSRVTSMEHLLEDAWSFNQPLDAWDVSQVTSLWKAFSHAEQFNQPLEAWNVTRVVNMAAMFAFAHSFNQPLAAWSGTHLHAVASERDHPAQVLDPDNKGSTSFSLNAHSPLTGRYRVRDLRLMFVSASSFNQNLCSWWDWDHYDVRTTPTKYWHRIFRDTSCPYDIDPEPGYACQECADVV